MSFGPILFQKLKKSPPNNCQECQLVRKLNWHGLCLQRFVSYSWTLFPNLLVEEEKCFVRTPGCHGAQVRIALPKTLFMAECTNYYCVMFIQLHSNRHLKALEKNDKSPVL